MERLLIHGGHALNGHVRIAGAKNAALPIMVASLLTTDPLVLSNVPLLADIHTMRQMLVHLGVSITPSSHRICLHADSLHADKVIPEAPYALVRKMRASILLLGALIARCGQAKVSLPGGCAIGTRPVDLHLHALRALGSDIRLEEGNIIASVPAKGLRGATFTLPSPSVGATENFLLAAVLAKGESRLSGCACEPEIIDLADCLNQMGAKIEGAGQNIIHIQGVSQLHGAEHSIIPDRIEAGSYILAAAACGGQIRLTHFDHQLLGDATKTTFAAVGIHLQPTRDGVTFEADPSQLRWRDVTTKPFPGFPTDLQAQLMSVLCQAKGTSSLTETVFENRFLHAAELKRMGADIVIDHNTARINGPTPLHGAQVMASDLRASFSLVIAALCAKGDTLIHRIYHIDRGYEQLEKKLGNLGAKLRRLDHHQIS